MNAPAPNRLKTVSLAPFFQSAAILAAGLWGVYAVSDQGADLLVALVETGMAWCF
ncbi:MAG: hypothetical protein JJ920_05385 [Roseitalea sp.]|jgi:hypothetical protein|nr:hypothetical protein [Roseitalea sp.]MBO6722548.1 hypothetical protein [Roseitalea sp.]MBO6742322.1 hypothetical protein [Roseitalea sp.]